MFDQEYELTITEISDKATDPLQYNDALKKICTIKSAEDLSYILHHIKPFGEGAKYNLNLFKSGINATWEDPENTQGCTWIAQFGLNVSDILFERLAAYFCLVGFKNFECNGIKLNIRKHHVKFEIWAKSVPTARECKDVLQELQNSLAIKTNINFSYKNHQELVNKISNVSKENIN
ncbi:translation initiation factor 4E [Enteropsectra breve]|nr:translation initiation factor 4E [Enteropsectra breve]